MSKRAWLSGDLAEFFKCQVVVGLLLIVRLLGRQHILPGPGPLFLHCTGPLPSHETGKIARFGHERPVLLDKEKCPQSHPSITLEIHQIQL